MTHWGRFNVSIVALSNHDKCSIILQYGENFTNIEISEQCNKTVSKILWTITVIRHFVKK